jgi:hypothetical protein
MYSIISIIKLKVLSAEKHLLSWINIVICGYMTKNQHHAAPFLRRCEIKYKEKSIKCVDAFSQCAVKFE